MRIDDITVTIVHGGREYTAELSGIDGRRVSIYRDGEWCGRGRLSESGRIEDCAADLGDDVYSALESAIAAQVGL